MTDFSTNQMVLYWEGKKEVQAEGTSDHNIMQKHNKLICLC
jgi:hypothetical protein